MEQLYIVFKSRHDGVKLSRKLEASDIAHEMVPTPRQFSHSCSISIRFGEGDLEAVQSILAYSPEIRGGGIHHAPQRKGWFSK